MTKAQKIEDAAANLKYVEDLIPRSAKLLIEKSIGGCYEARIYKLDDNSILGFWEDDEGQGFVIDPDEFPESIQLNTEIQFLWPEI